ncbi:MAG TPA: hypothetical protein HA362_02415 [Nanoarchaeota archaeon]|nr:hypothetical protein [Nanoarchaeota archaeon]
MIESKVISILEEKINKEFRFEEWAETRGGYKTEVKGYTFCLLLERREDEEFGTGKSCWVDRYRISVCKGEDTIFELHDDGRTQAYPYAFYKVISAKFSEMREKEAERGRLGAMKDGLDKEKRFLKDMGS